MKEASRKVYTRYDYIYMMGSKGQSYSDGEHVSVCRWSGTRRGCGHGGKAVRWGVVETSSLVMVTRIYTRVKMHRTLYWDKVNVKNKYVEDGLEGVRQGHFNPRNVWNCTE